MLIVSIALGKRCKSVIS